MCNLLAEIKEVSALYAELLHARSQQGLYRPVRLELATGHCLHETNSSFKFYTYTFHYENYPQPGWDSPTVMHVDRGPSPGLTNLLC